MMSDKLTETPDKINNMPSLPALVEGLFAKLCVFLLSSIPVVATVIRKLLS